MPPWPPPMMSVSGCVLKPSSAASFSRSSFHVGRFLPEPCLAPIGRAKPAFSSWPFNSAIVVSSVQILPSFSLIWPKPRASSVSKLIQPSISPPLGRPRPWRWQSDGLVVDNGSSACRDLVLAFHGPDVQVKARGRASSSRLETADGSQCHWRRGAELIEAGRIVSGWGLSSISLLREIRPSWWLLRAGRSSIGRARPVTPHHSFAWLQGLIWLLPPNWSGFLLRGHEGCCGLGDQRCSAGREIVTAIFNWETPSSPPRRSR